MKAKFLKQKYIITILSLILSVVLIGCSHNTPAADSQNKKDAPISKNSSKEVSSTEVSSAEVSPTEESPAVKSEKDSPKPAKVSGKVKLYGGTYFDDRCFGDDEVKNFCEVMIFNVTDTSFDFAVYQVDEKKGEKKIIFLKNTAVFIGDGTKAAFYGKNYTLNFTFPNKHNAYPVVTDMEISGFEPLKGKTYVNNGIPGHEFS